MTSERVDYKKNWLHPGLTRAANTCLCAAEYIFCDPDASVSEDDARDGDPYIISKSLLHEMLGPQPKPGLWLIMWNRDGRNPAVRHMTRLPSNAFDFEVFDDTFSCIEDMMAVDVCDQHCIAGAWLFEVYHGK